MQQIEELFNEFEKKLLEISLYASFITEESIKKYKEYLEKFSEFDFSKNNILDNNIVGKRLVYFDILNKHEKILSDSKIEKMQMNFLKMQNITKINNYNGYL
ncbi:hypothetical protein [Aliarcobacter butzleri]|uniref:hypothetical protein n=1 Tax=Aliarcobacter butzleri TaxID=28197 RepID=UPI00102D7F74|nr:hypothetical protein [Aliarcobacter butzleri]RZV19053.1 hypothetical protein D3M75_03780 [Aliarcobacter butzleri]